MQAVPRVLIGIVVAILFLVAARVAERLKAAGRLYPCFETPEELSLKRKTQINAGKPPVYDRAALKLTAEERFFLAKAREEAVDLLSSWGGTALYDAMGRTLERTHDYINQLAPADRPERVVMAVFTDGHENSSRRFTHATLQDLIGRRRQKDDWQILFLAASPDVVEEARHLGVEMVVSLGALLADIPHTRPVQVTGIANVAPHRRITPPHGVGVKP